MGIEQGIFNRTQLLYGKEGMRSLSEARVIIFGIGGVGSWCAESLIRSGIGHLTIVDSDRICITNVNRQLHATTRTVGEVKTEVLRNRLLEINPNADILALQKIYSPETRSEFELDSYDYIVDAIDSLKNKVDLIRSATRTSAMLVSSMGAALKVDPTRIQVAEFWKVKGDPLAAAMRRSIKKGELPAKKFLCVYSDEVLPNLGSNAACGTEKCMCPRSKDVKGNPELANHEWCSLKAAINGSLSHITAIFGFTLAGLIMKDIYKTLNQQDHEE